ncbi:MAG: histidine--tRNA ligase [Candidatus Paceibacterota bacterium]
MSNVKPELPGGFKDYLPSDQKKREYLLNKIEQAFQKFGFSPMENPGVELLDTLTGGDPNFEKEVFEVGQVSSDKENRMGLRFDLTVPLVRSIAMNINDVNLPLKVYRIGKVWRGEKSQAGRYREFLQCDVDIIGSSRIEADAEMLAVIYDVFINIGIKNFKIKINSRGLLSNFFKTLKIDDKDIKDVLIIIDKLDKLSWEKVSEELTNKGLDKSQLESIKGFVESDIEKLKENYSDNDSLMDSIKELEEIINIAEVLGVERSQVEVDFSIVRGLDYYTGPIFETVLTDNPDLGSVFSGGRYDNLIEKFTSSKIPATGVSLGFDRLYEGIKDLDLFDGEKSVPSVLILNFEESCQKEYLQALRELRREGISSSIYTGQEDNLKGQLSYAVKESIPIVLIMGKKEKEEGIFQIKDMKNRMQDSVAIKFLVEKVKESLIK